MRLREGGARVIRAHFELTVTAQIEYNFRLNRGVEQSGSSSGS